MSAHKYEWTRFISYLHTSKRTIFLSNISMSLPGVATMMCTPLELQENRIKNKKKLWGNIPILLDDDTNNNT